MSILKKVFLGALGIFILVQFIPIDRKTPAVDKNMDFLEVTKAPVAVASLLKSTCYDCHSYETKYPWYANIAPASWWLQGHINEGREHLNFSTWATNPEKGELMEECAEEVSEGNMPLNSYTLIHSEARLNQAQVQQLVAWFNQNGGGETGRSTFAPKEETEGDDD